MIMRTPWKSPLLPYADMCIGGVLRCDSERNNKPSRVGILKERKTRIDRNGGKCYRR